MKHQAKQKISKAEITEILNEVQGRSMVDPSTLDTPAFKLIEQEYRQQIRKGPNYFCDICWKIEYRSWILQSMIKSFLNNVILINIVMIKRFI